MDVGGVVVAGFACRVAMTSFTLPRATWVLPMLTATVLVVNPYGNRSLDCK